MKKGFTLIEVAITILILTGLFAVVFAVGSSFFYYSSTNEAVQERLHFSSILAEGEKWCRENGTDTTITNTANPVYDGKSYTAKTTCTYQGGSLYKVFVEITDEQGNTYNEESYITK